MNGFWKSWMIGWCMMVLAFGVMLAATAVPALDGAARLFYSLVTGFSRDMTGVFDPPGTRFSVALLGAVTIGWGVMMLGMVRTADSDPGRWQILTRGVIAWYVIDSLLSIFTGFPGNAVSNSVLLAAYLVPVLQSGVLREQSRPAAARQAA